MSKKGSNFGAKKTVATHSIKQNLKRTTIVKKIVYSGNGGKLQNISKIINFLDHLVVILDSGFLRLGLHCLGGSTLGAILGGSH